MAVLTNLFDVAMVFAVALMVALVTRFDMTEMFSQEDFTMVKNPGTDRMEIITKKRRNHRKIHPPRKNRRTTARAADGSAQPTSSTAARSSTFPNSPGNTASRRETVSCGLPPVLCPPPTFP